MCRADLNNFGLHRPDPLRLLSVNAFYLNLKLSASPFLHNSLTLVYLPRINGSPLEINGSSIRPDSPAYLTLHRLVNADSGAGPLVFGSTEETRVGEGVRFEVYIGDEKLLKGVFRRGEKRWRVDCTCVLEREIDGLGVLEAEVCVAAEGGGMRERVAVAEKRRRRRRRGGVEWGLEEIPEVAEEGAEGAWDAPCECCCSGSGSDGWEEMEEDLTAVEEAEMEGVRWAVDVGIWVVCLGVGYLVSRASSKRLRRRNFLA